MIDAKTKAISLVHKFGNIECDVKDCDLFICHTAAKQCAIITVDEILKIVYIYNDTQHEYAYWNQVKEQINQL